MSKHSIPLDKTTMDKVSRQLEKGVVLNKPPAGEKPILQRPVQTPSSKPSEQTSQAEQASSAPKKP